MIKLTSTNTKNALLIVIGIATVLSGAALLLTGDSPFPVVILGAFVAFLLYTIWDPPKKQRDFTDSDRLKATSRAMGGSGPPELPITNRPPLKGYKEDSLLTSIHMKAGKAGLDKMTDVEIEAEIKAARKKRAGNKKKIR